MKNNQSVYVNYQSRNRENPIWRELSPHAFAYDGFRWHIRAFCHMTKEFRDFIPARILSVDQIRTSNVNITKDYLWHEFVDVVITPNAEISEVVREQLAREMEMTQMYKVLQIRGAMLYYFRKRYHLQPNFQPMYDLIPETALPPKDEQILPEFIVTNGDEVQKMYNKIVEKAARETNYYK